MIKKPLLEWKQGNLIVVKRFNKYRGYNDFNICREVEDFYSLPENCSDEEVMKKYWEIRDNIIGSIRFNKEEGRYLIKADPRELLKFTKEELIFIINTTIKIDEMKDPPK